MSKPLPVGLLELLRRPSPCFIATLMADGSPQLTETWGTTDGQNIVINIVDGMQKSRNIARDGRVAVNVVDPDDVFRYYAVRGRVTGTTTEGGRRASTRSPRSTSVRSIRTPAATPTRFAC